MPANKEVTAQQIFERLLAGKTVKVPIYTGISQLESYLRVLISRRKIALTELGMSYDHKTLSVRHPMPASEADAYAIFALVPPESKKLFTIIEDDNSDSGSTEEAK